MTKHNFKYIKNLMMYEESQDFIVKSEKRKQWIYRFKNNYGVSIILHRGSYGHPNKFECSMIHFPKKDDESWRMSNNNRLMKNDVKGYMTKEDVNRLLTEVKHYSKEYMDLKEVLE